MTSVEEFTLKQDQELIYKTERIQKNASRFEPKKLHEKRSADLDKFEKRLASDKEYFKNNPGLKFTKRSKSGNLIGAKEAEIERLETLKKGLKVTFGILTAIETLGIASAIFGAGVVVAEGFEAGLTIAEITAQASAKAGLDVIGESSLSAVANKTGSFLAQKGLEKGATELTKKTLTTIVDNKLQASKNRLEHENQGSDPLFPDYVDPVLDHTVATNTSTKDPIMGAPKDFVDDIGFGSGNDPNKDIGFGPGKTEANDDQDPEPRPKEDQITSDHVREHINGSGIGTEPSDQTVDDIRDAVNAGVPLSEALLLFSDELEHTYNDTLDSIENSSQKVKESLDSLIIYDQSGSIVNLESLGISGYKFSDTFELGLNTGKQLGSVVATMSLLESRKGLQGLSRSKKLLYSSLKSIQRSPQNAFISKKMNKYLMSSDFIQNPVKQANEYNLLAQIYDGKFGSEPFVDDEGKFSIIDETGSKITYTGSKGYTTILGKKFKNPTLHGTWVGPQSPNDRLPEDYLDSLAMIHDTEYERGYFDTTADAKLVSRIESNMDKFEGIAWYKAKFTAAWFKTLGPLMSKLTNQELSEQEKSRILFSDQDDFFSSLVPADQQKRLTTSGYSGVNLVQNRLQRSKARDSFYSGLRAGLNESFKYHSANVGIPQDKMSNLYIIEALGSIPITLN